LFSTRWKTSCLHMNTLYFTIKSNWIDIPMTYYQSLAITIVQLLHHDIQFLKLSSPFQIWNNCPNNANTMLACGQKWRGVYCCKAVWTASSDLQKTGTHFKAIAPYCLSNSTLTLWKVDSVIAFGEYWFTSMLSFVVEAHSTVSFLSSCCDSLQRIPAWTLFLFFHILYYNNIVLLFFSSTELSFFKVAANQNHFGALATLFISATFSFLSNDANFSSSTASVAAYFLIDRLWLMDLMKYTKFHHNLHLTSCHHPKWTLGW